MAGLLLLYLLACLGTSSSFSNQTLYDRATFRSTDPERSLRDDYNSPERSRRQAEMEWTDGNQCFRECSRGDTRICYFEWVIERYNVLGPACRNCTEGSMADCWAPQCVPATGFRKGILTINRQLPGPPIHVCEGDRIVVDVVNRMGDHATTIHWHGIRQLGTPHMDGAHMITQCPITPGTTFRYSFMAERGTHFYHSHTGAQKLDGINGPLIVRTSRREDIQSSLYDEDRPEHVIFLQDWIHRRGEDWIPGTHERESVQVPDAILINGLGRLSTNGTNMGVPVANFTVDSGRRYRFRIVGATCMTCAFAVRVEGHRMLAISADGQLNFRPTPVDSIVINSADRFDFVLEANQTAGAYYIFVQSLNDFCQGIRQVAILRYRAVANRPVRRPPPPTGDLGVQLNPANSTCEGDSNELCMSHLIGEFNAPALAAGNRAYYQYHVAFGFYEFELDDLFAPGTYQHYEEPIYGRLVKALTNNISFAFPPSPMLSQWGDIPPELICSEQCRTEEIEKACSCANVYEIAMDAVVDLIVFDTGERDGFNHPFHLHGYNFFVMDMGTFVEAREERQIQLDQISQRTANDQINRRRRPMRDTVNVPSRGYSILRFIADNPGYWLFHCHFLYHLEAGMGAVYKVGEDSEIPPPPRGFPTCGNFLG